MASWIVQLYPSGRREDCNDYISLFLGKIKPADDIEANFVLSYLDSESIKQKIKELGASTFKTSGWGWDKLIKKNDLSKYTSDDVLTLFVEITILGDTKKSIEFVKSGDIGGKSSALTENYHHKQLAHDVEKLFLSKEHSDVIIRCGDKVYDCHKIILTSRSPVFKMMLESNMKEKITGDIVIKNMDHEVLEDLLQYMYSGVAPNIDGHTQELFAAADQYQLDKLKELCEMKLCSRLDVNNCINLLILSDLHSASSLKAAALEYMSKNVHKMNPSEWTESLIAHPALIAEVMVKMLPKKDENNTAAEVKKRASS